MRISSRALLAALQADLAPAALSPDRFRPLMDLAVNLFHAERTLLMVLTPEDRFEFHSSQFVDGPTEVALERLGRALVKEWTRQPFLLFSPESVTPEFAGGLLKRRPFRQQSFVCLVLSEGPRISGLCFLDGAQSSEIQKEPETRNMDIFHRLCTSYLGSDTRFRQLARGNETLLARLERSELEDLEREGILKTLEKHRGNISKAHVELGIPRMSFYQKIRRYRIKTQPLRTRPAAPSR